MERTGTNRNGGRLAEKLKSEYKHRGLGADPSHASENRGESFGRSRTGREQRRQWDNSFRAPYEDRANGGAGQVEITVEKKRIPASFVLALVFCTMMIMLIITSVAQIYQTTREISSLEKEVVSLKENIDDLELKLDEKNDIRLIEQMASVSLGMVKEESVQKKYISLSDGERVDLVETPEEPSEKGLGTMLSSFFALFGDLLN